MFADIAPAQFIVLPDLPHLYKEILIWGAAI